MPDQNESNDGKKTHYLTSSEGNHERYRKCDPTLYDALGTIVDSGCRDVRRVCELNVLPPRTVFYETPLSFADRSSAQERLSERNAWLQRALDLTAPCQLVFVDPDNGLQVATEAHQKKGPKYVFFEELHPFCKRGQSLVIYHHIGRRRSAKEQVKERLRQIRHQLGLQGFALLFHRGSARAFFIVPAKPHSDLLLDRAKRFVDGAWGAHFELLAGET
ncbi:MAG: hypothetical protein HYY01_02240 [Chloroflexi bacterium]|nr:hypothetical protein [Chloroflexota bacterium]